MSPTAVAAAPEGAAFLAVSVKQLKPSSLNPRKHFDEAKLKDLAATMGNGVGVIEPLVVRSVKGHFEIVAGERRWRAAQIAGLAEVPVIVKDLSDAQVLEIMVIENDQREDINPLEEGTGFKGLMTFGFDVDKLAARIGKSRKYIYDRVKLLDLIKPAQRLLLDGRITAGHAILIARLTPDQQAQIIAVDEDGYSSYQRTPLFEPESSLLTPAEDDAEEKARKKDPYVGLKARSVRELEAWIAEHCRFDALAPVNQELFPATAAVIQQAAEDKEKVVFITHNHHVDPDAKDGNSQRIYSHVSWKRADGREKTKTCDKSVTGVIVVGPGRGEAFKVCVNKDCDTHWKQERVKRAKQSDVAAGQRERMERDRKRHEDERRKEDARREQWRKARPQILTATADRIKAAKLSALTDIVVRQFEGSMMSAATKALGKPKTAEDVLRVLALSELQRVAASDWYGPQEFPKLAKTLGLDVAPILKKVAAQTAAPDAQAAAKPKAAKTARKKR